MDKEKFIKWVNERKEFYSGIWYEMFAVSDDEERRQYINGKVSILNQILDLTKRGDFDDIHSN